MRWPYALWHNKLWSVHPNDQTASYRPDKAFRHRGPAAGVHQVACWEQAGYGRTAMGGAGVRPCAPPFRSRGSTWRTGKEIFLQLVEVVRKVTRRKLQGLLDARDYEGLEAC